MRLLVCGGRDFRDFVLLVKTLEPLRHQIEVLIHGAARGADSMAAEWAERRKVPTLAFHPDWDRFGKSAGIRRNADMLIEFSAWSPYTTAPFILRGS